MQELARRAEAARRLSRALRRLQRPNGERARGHFVIALPEDSVEYVSTQVIDAGGVASIVVAFPGRLHVFGWETVPATETPIFDQVEAQCVDPSASMDMLVELLRLDPNDAQFIRIQKAGRICISDGETVLAPA